MLRFLDRRLCLEWVWSGLVREIWICKGAGLAGCVAAQRGMLVLFFG